MKMRIPEPILWVMHHIEQAKEEVYLVGGCVRDMLLHREIHDYDLTTSMPVQDMIRLFSTCDCKVILTGFKHGTITIMKQHTAIEITTYRIDCDYENHRAPNYVTFTKNLEEDLRRRDFTVNAMAYHPEKGILDMFHGQEDLEAKIIRCVGDPDKRFTEDALRVLRALRFSCQLRFTIEEKTKASILKNHSLLTYISKERIREEFTKLLLSDYADLLTYLRSMNVLHHILPGIEMIYDFEQHSPWHRYDVFIHTDKALNQASHEDLHIKLAIILHDIGKVKAQIFKGDIAHYYGHAQISAELAKRMLRNLTFPKAFILEVCTLIYYHDTYVLNRSQMRKMLFRFGNNFEQVKRLLIIQSCDDSAKVDEKVILQKQQNQTNRFLLGTMQKEHDILNKKDLQVNGNDMIALGFEKAEIGNVLEYLFQIVLKTPASNTKEKLMAFAINYKSTQNKNLLNGQTHDHINR